METTNQDSKLLSNAQAYGLAIICLFLGIIVGYLLHPKKPAAARMTQAGLPAGFMKGGMPTREGLRHMADKQAEPLFIALQKDPNDADVLTEIAGIYSRARQFPLAAEYYERANRSKPTAARLVFASNAYHSAGQDDRAIESLNRALELDPKSANALVNLGLLTWQVKNDPKGAIQYWQRMLKSNPDHPRRAEVEKMIAQARKHMNLAAGGKTNKPAM